MLLIRRPRLIKKRISGAMLLRGIFGAACLAVLPAAAADGSASHPPACPAPAGLVTIERWSAPLTAHLADGRSVRLADLRAPHDVAPELPVGQAMLFAAAARDRWGRIVGDLVPEDTGVGLRASLVSRGIAFIDPAAIPKACDADLRTLERGAERAELGWWDRTFILGAHQPGLLDHVGTMVFVVGKVASVGDTRRTVYLNFGEDYRTDFTVMIDKRFAADWGMDPASLDGASVRVRGVLEAWNGGLIRVEHPAQIERGEFRAR